MKCGATISAEATFCKKCGSSQTITESSTVTNGKDVVKPIDIGSVPLSSLTKRQWSTIAIIFTVGIAAVVGFLVATDGGKQVTLAKVTENQIRTVVPTGEWMCQGKNNKEGVWEKAFQFKVDTSKSRVVTPTGPILPIEGNPAIFNSAKTAYRSDIYSAFGFWNVSEDVIQFTWNATWVKDPTSTREMARQFAGANLIPGGIPIDLALVDNLRRGILVSTSEQGLHAEEIKLETLSPAHMSGTSRVVYFKSDKSRNPGKYFPIKCDRLLVAPAEQKASPEQNTPPQSALITTQNVPPTPVASEVKQPDAPAQTQQQLAVDNIRKRAFACQNIQDCMRIMLDGVDPLQPEVIQLVVDRIGSLNKAQRGDRKLARNLNQKGLDESKNNNLSGAMDLLKRAVSADPADVEIASNLGYVALRANKIEVADQALSSALLLDPRRTSAWVPIAELFTLKGDKGAAVRALLLGYEFSGNKEKSMTFFEDKANTAEREAMRPIYALAIQKIKALLERAALLPTFPKSTLYREARNQLIKMGWSPVTLPNAEKCGESDSRCKGLPEMLSCLPTGTAACIFAWKQGELKVDVIGVGEEDQIVDKVLCRSGC